MKDITDRGRVDALARRFVDALHALDARGDAAVDAMVELFADDASITNPALRRAGHEREGRDGVRRFWAEYARTFPDARTEFAAVTVGERAVGLFWTTRGTAADGTAVEYDGASFLELGDDGRIARFGGYYDPEDLRLETLADGGATR